MRGNAGVHWRPLMVEEPLVWAGSSIPCVSLVCGERLDSFFPQATQDYTILLDEIVLDLQLPTGAHSLELLSQEGAMSPSSMNVHGGQVI